MKLIVGNNFDIVYSNVKWVVDSLEHNNIYVMKDSTTCYKYPATKFDSIIVNTCNPLRFIKSVDKVLLHRCEFMVNLRKFSGIDVDPCIKDTLEATRLVNPNRFTWKFTKVRLYNMYSILKFVKSFTRIAKKLGGVIKHVIICYSDDMFDKNTKHTISLIREFTNRISEVAARYGIKKVDYLGSKLPVAYRTLKCLRCANKWIDSDDKIDLSNATLAMVDQPESVTEENLNKLEIREVK